MFKLCFRLNFLPWFELSLQLGLNNELSKLDIWISSTLKLFLVVIGMKVYLLIVPLFSIPSFDMVVDISH